MNETESDAILMEKVRGGDTEAFGRLASRYQHRLLRYAARMVGADAAADIVQETFLRLWQNRTVYSDGDAGLSAYLFRIAANLCRDFARRSHPTLPIEVICNYAAAPSDFTVSATEAAVHSALAGLPADLREVFILSHYEGLRYREIAALLGCPIGTVASRKHLAVESLRRRLLPFFEEESYDRESARL